MSVKVIEARARITAQDEASAKFAALAKRLEGFSKAQTAFAASGGQKFAAVSKEIDAIAGKLAKVDAFRAMKRELNDVADKHRQAQREASKLKAATDAAGGANAKLAQDFQRASRAADAAREAFRTQGQATRTALNEMMSAGIPLKKLAESERLLTQQIQSATAAMTAQAQAQRKLQAGPWGPRPVSGSGVPLAPPPPPGRTPVPAGAGQHLAGVGQHLPGAVAAGVVAYKGKEVAKDILQRAAEFDYAVRRQRAYAGLSEDEQKRILIPQAERIGADIKFTNKDVVEAQTTVASRLPGHLKNAATIAPLVAQMKNYGMVMKGTTLDDAAQAVTGFLLSTGKDISTPEKADAESRRASNLLIRMSKLGAMSHEDIMPFVQRGVSAGRIAGLSDETMGALGVGMKRSNISGDQAGTALRTLAAKLVAPTSKGLSALATAGINYDDFTRMPGGLSVDSLEGKFKQDFGKSFTPEIREKLSGVLSDTDIVGDRGRFTEAVTEAVSSLFNPKADGTMRASDQRTVAKKVGDFHKYSTESVDSEGLLQAILARDPSLGVLNAFATDKHGAKLGLLARSFDQFQSDRDTLRSTPGDFGDKISALITGGLGGALERLIGAIDTAYNRIGRANEAWLTPSIDKIGNAIEAISGAPEKLIEFTTQVGLAALALTALRTGSGVASVAAGAATAAGVTGAGVTALGTAGRVGTTVASLGMRGLGWGSLAYAGYQALDYAIGGRNREKYKDIAPGDVHNEGRNRRRAYHDALRQQTQGVRDEQEGAGPRRLPALAASGLDFSSLDGIRTTLSEPLDITGRLDPVTLEGQATVSITVRTEGGAQVTGLSATSSGHVKAEGVAMIGTFGRN